MLIPLVQIWPIACFKGEAVMSKQEFYVALRLVTLAQAGAKVTRKNFVENLHIHLPVPQFDLSHLPYGMSVDEEAQYRAVYASLSTSGSAHFLDDDKASRVLLTSGLEKPVLERLWSLSDNDADGHLNDNEFCVAMHLIRCVNGGKPLPMALPVELIKASLSCIPHYVCSLSQFL
jgi:hypothetical protein